MSLPMACSSRLTLLLKSSRRNYFATAGICELVLPGKDQEVCRFAGLVKPLLAVEFLLRSPRAGFGSRDSLARGLNAL